MANDVSGTRPVLLVAGLLLLIAGLIAGDLWVDYAAGTTVGHLTLELAVLVLALGGVVALWHQFQAARETVLVLRQDVEAAREEAVKWRGEAKSAITEFRQAIERQFERWRLSEAEQDVAMCLLRGLSHKEVAFRRNTSERTVREQARAVYQKSGVGGRTGLAAFFLGDLTTGEIER